MAEPVATPAPAPGVVATAIPARLDRLPWSPFHTLVVVALGVTWILDGLEVTLAGSVSGALKDSPVLRFSNTEVGMAGAAYLAGAVIGALFFGWLTDRLGRKKLFTVTLLVSMNSAVISTSTDRMIESASSMSSSRLGNGKMSTTRMPMTPIARNRSGRLRSFPIPPRLISKPPPAAAAVVTSVIDQPAPRAELRTHPAILAGHRVNEWLRRPD